MIKEIISKEVNEDGQYSVQLDSTQDISTHDQCSIVVRYFLNDTAKERLLHLVKGDEASGRGYHNLLGESLTNVGVSLKGCVSDSLDGASNMSGIYSGV